MGDEQKFDRFKPAAPQIPGVPGPGQTPAPALAKRPPMAVLAGGGAAALLILVLVIWWAMKPATSSAPAAVPLSPAATTAASPAATAVASPRVVPPTAPGPIGTVQEFNRPWSSKKFFFRRPLDGELVTAYVVRLPVGSPRSSSGYWAFAAGKPGQECALEYETDLGKITREYGYRASHAMAVDPCNQSVYDPLQLADVFGVLIRGDVVRGPAGRPPQMILIRVEGNSIIASQIE
jgi:Rieske Fe-S protein